MGRNPVVDRVLRHLGLVHLQIGEALRVRRPEVVAARLQLFFVDPVHLAVEDGRVGGGSHDGGGRAGLAQLDDGEAVVANEGDGFAVGRELGIVAGAGAGKANLNAGAVAQIVDPQPAVGVEEQVRRVRRPEVAGHPVALAMVAVRLRCFALA